MFKNILFFLIIFLFSCSTTSNVKTNVFEKKIEIISEKKIEEKIAQMIMIRANGKFLNNDH